MLINMTINFHHQKTKCKLKISRKNQIPGANNALAISAFAISCWGNLVKTLTKFLSLSQVFWKILGTHETLDILDRLAFGRPILLVFLVYRWQSAEGKITRTIGTFRDSLVFSLVLRDRLTANKRDVLANVANDSESFHRTAVSENKATFWKK